MRKIAIITASIGAGHNQVAKYVKENLQNIMPLGEFIIYDLLDEKNLYSLTKNIYLGVLKKAPIIYSKAYYWSQKQEKTKSLTSIYDFLSLRFLKNIQKSFNPDGFIFTHPFPASAYSSAGLSPAWVIITSYGFHPIWYNSQITGYFVPNEQVASCLNKMGYPKKDSHVTGIPISNKFIATKEKKLQESYLRNIKNPEILIMGGGLGIGPLVEVINSLKEIKTPFTSTVLTGENAALLHYLHNKLQHDKRWNIVGYTSNVDMYMKKASLLITKAGAITLTEASVCGLPLIIYKPLPGQEEENANYFCERKAALWAKNPEDLVTKTASLLADSVMMENMAKQSTKISRPYASRNVSCEIIYRLLLFKKEINMKASNEHISKP